MKIIKYKTDKENKIIALLTNTKNKLFNRSIKARKMLEKGTKKSVKEGRIHRSIK